MRCPHAEVGRKKTIALPGRSWQINRAARGKHPHRAARARWSKVLTGRRMSNKKQKKLKFGLPKGSLQEATIAKMAKAGWNIQVSSRSYIPYVDD